MHTVSIQWCINVISRRQGWSFYADHLLLVFGVGDGLHLLVLFHLRKHSALQVASFTHTCCTHHWLKAIGSNLGSGVLFTDTWICRARDLTITPVVNKMSCSSNLPHKTNKVILYVYMKTHTKSDIHFDTLCSFPACMSMWVPFGLQYGCYNGFDFTCGTVLMQPT